MPCTLLAQNCLIPLLTFLGWMPYTCGDFTKGDGQMQRYKETNSITLWPRAFAPFAGTLIVPSGSGLTGRIVPISLAACSDNT